MKTLLIFDIDGTITDSVAVHQKAFMNALKQFGFTEFDDDWNGYLHHTDSYIFKTIFKNHTGKWSTKTDIRKFERLLTTSIEELNCKQKLREINGSKKFLNCVNGQLQCDIVFATGSLFTPAKLKLNFTGIHIDDELLITSNNTQSRQNIVKKAIKKAREFYGVENYGQIISFGDGKWDHDVAKKLNLEFIGINNRYLVSNDVKYFFSDFADSSLRKLIEDKITGLYKITSTQGISIGFMKLNIYNYTSALNYIRHLPYGRNLDKKKLETVLTDGCGTCSTKHALLKQLALENNWDDVKLFIGLFKMNATNTPETAITLEKAQLEYIPEAHCYLKVCGEIVDVTKPDSNPQDFLQDLIEEIEIQPDQIVEFKIEYHKAYLQNWLHLNKDIKYSLDALWKIRERCIKDLENK